MWRLAALLAVPVLALLLLLGTAPLWIDTPLVRERVAAMVVDLTGGRARWDGVDLHYFPRPSVTLRQLSLTLPPRADFEVHAVTVELEWLPLLRGSVRPGRLRLDSPRLRVQLSPADPAAAPPTVVGIRNAIRRAVEALFENAPSSQVELAAGEVYVLTGAGMPLQFTRISLEGRVAGGRLDVKASLSSPLFRELALQARIHRTGLKGEGQAQLTGLQLASLGSFAASAALSPGARLSLEPAAGRVDLEWRLEGANALSANVRATVPALAVRRGAGRLEVSGLGLDARASLLGEALEVELSRAVSMRPGIEAKGRLAFAPGTGWRASLDLARLDAGEAQALVAGLLPGVPAIARPVAQLQAGSVITASLASAGATLAALANLRSVKAAAHMESGAVRVAAADLAVRDIRIRARLVDGALQVDDLAARTRAGEVTGGTFHMNLTANPVSLEGSAAGRLDLEGTLALARRVLDPAGGAARELRRLRELRGSARFAVALAGKASRPRARVDLSALHATGRVDGLPLPIALTGGLATLEGPRLQVRGLAGSVGRSRLQDASARLTLGRQGRLESASASAVIDVEEALALARAQPALAGRLSQVQSASGELALKLESATGPLADARALRYVLTAVPRRAVVTLPALGAPLTLDGGRVTLAPGALAATDVTASLRDAALRAGGRIPLPMGPAGGLQLDASGSIGPELLEWTYTRAQLPEAARLPRALAVESLALRWREADAFEVRGSVQPAGGPGAVFHLRRAGRRVELRSLALRDAHSDCTLGGSLEGSRFEVRFDGHVAGRSLAGLLRRPELAGALVRGRFEASGDWTNPASTRAEGGLEVTQVPVSAPSAQALVVERARVEATPERLRIPAAVLRLGAARVDVEASLTRTTRKFMLDASVRGDELDLRHPPRATGTAGAPAEPQAGGAPAANPRASPWETLFAALDRVPVSGRVQVAFARVLANRIEVAPLEAAASLEDGRLDVDIRRAALCGISVAGSLWARRGLAGTKGTLSARGAALDATLPCLTDGRLRFAGKLDLDGTFSAQGAPGAIMDNLNGSFRAVSREGRIDRFEALARLLRLLNLTEVVRGQVPDLASGGMSYRSAAVTGRIRGRVLHLDEGILDAETVKIVGEGSLDTRSGALTANVLAAPLQTANWLVDKIPLVRRIFGGTVLAIPAQVSGTVKNPVVVPLGPRAVGSRATQLLANTLRLPVDVLKMLEPKNAPPVSNETQKDETARPP